MDNSYCVFINDANDGKDGKRKFPLNRIRTSKYTLLTFLPLNLFEQFRRFANIYFLLIIFLQLIPGVSPFPLWTAVVPVVIILGASALKEAAEDFYRHRSDRKANHAPFVTLAADGSLKNVRCDQIRVGMILHISKGDEFPADMILLQSAKPNGSCSITTGSLDGEALAKPRMAPDCTQQMDWGQLSQAKGHVQCQEPNSQLYGFQGVLCITSTSEDPEKPMNAEQWGLEDKAVLLRSARLHGPDWVMGVVVYTGKDTKMMLNRNPARFKFSRFERKINKLIAIMFALKLLMCSILSLYYAYGTGHNSWCDANFLTITHANATFNFITHFILFSFMIPLPLYLTIELVFIGQAWFIKNDRRMFAPLPLDHSKIKGLKVKNASLNPDLGRIEYIFTDKTGTLTENEMDLSNVYINSKFFYYQAKGVEYGDKKLKKKLQLRQLTKELFGKNAFEHLELPKTHAAKSTRHPLPKLPPSPKNNNALSTLPPVAGATGGNELSLPAIGSSGMISSAGTSSAGTGELPDINQKGNSRTSLPMMPLAGMTRTKSKDRLKTTRFAPEAPLEGVDFFLALLLCNSANVIETGSPAEGTFQRLYQSESPDEVALLLAMDSMGLTLESRMGDEARIKLHDQDHQIGARIVHARIQCPAVLPFESANRRMSVVVRLPDGKLKLYVKGADSAVLPLLRTQSGDDKKIQQDAEDATLQMSVGGSRTLAVACKEISEELFADWYPRYKEASLAMEDRNVKITKAFMELERNLRFLGCTAVDDQMQDGVPETVGLMLRAGIRIIVLTGDKKETAVSIGKASQIIGESTRLLYLEGSSLGAAQLSLQLAQKAVQASDQKQSQVEIGPRELSPVSAKELDRPLSAKKFRLLRSASSMKRLPSLDSDGRSDSLRRSKTSVRGPKSQAEDKKRLINQTEEDKLMFERKIVLVAEGNALQLLLKFNAAQVLALIQRCETMVCYRSTPQQKSLVTKIIKNTWNVVTLAVGDGANDVSMILEANVGIGVMGKEGTHAAQSADFVMVRFKHLQRLLLVHGRWSLLRSSESVFLNLYKSLAFPLPIFFYGFMAGGSGTTFYDAVFLNFFSALYASAPPVIVGIFDQDIKQDTLLKYPEAYKTFREAPSMGLGALSSWLIMGAWHAFIIYFTMSGLGTDEVMINGQAYSGDMLTLGNSICFVMVLAINLGMISIASVFPFIIFASAIFGQGLYIITFATLDSTPSAEMFGVGTPMLGSMNAWLTMLFALVMCFLPSFLWSSYLAIYNPGVVHRLLETLRAEKNKRVVPFAEIEMDEDPEQNDEQDVNADEERPLRRQNSL